MKRTAKRLIIAAIVPLLFCIGLVAFAQPAPRPMTPKARPVATAPTARPAMAPTMAPVAAPTPAMAPAPTPTADKPTTAPAPTKKADDKKKDSWWKVLLGGLSETAITFLLFILLGLGGLAIKWVAKKMKIEDATQITQMENVWSTLIGMGANYANQMAHKLRDNPDKKGKKMDWAVEFVQKLIKDWKLPEKSADWIKKRVEAKLGGTERGGLKIEGLALGEADKPKTDPT